jgi:hypothetical protein
MTNQSMEELLYPDWREARLRFMRDNPATSMALALTEPPETYEEYVASLPPPPAEKE